MLYLPVGLTSPSELCCSRSLSMTADSELFLERTGDLWPLPEERPDEDKPSVGHVALEWQLALLTSASVNNRKCQRLVIVLSRHEKIMTYRSQKATWTWIP